MKKLLLVVLLSGISFCSFAQQQGFVAPTGQESSKGGGSGPTSGVTSIEKAKTLSDNARVVLEGNIIKQIDHELYELRDKSGTVNIDIDDRLWMGQTVSPETKIRIEGEVDKDWNSVEIDVDNLTVLK